MKKVLITLAVIVAAIAMLASYISARGNKDFDVPLPGNVTASKDSAIVARGRYLAYGPAHCASCHTPVSMKNEIDKGVELPMIGGWEVSIAPGIMRAPNLTPDMETGIGKISDGELARALRYSVNHNKKAMFPFMPFQEMSDEDVVAIVSFLRSQKPERNEVKPTEYSMLGKALIAFGAFTPVGPVNTPPKSVAIDTTVAYGEYIANRVANCAGCHTERDLKTGMATGPLFAGGLTLPADQLSEGYTFVTPNITPDPETGIMANWTEQAFINRFRAGRVYKGSQMPWGSFSRMSEPELKAVYRYLRSLKPVKRKVEKVAYAPGEKLPE